MRKSTSSKGNAASLLQLHIELAWLKQAVWRRIVVPEAITLPKLHKIIQATMGWTNSHMHEFEIGHQRYGSPDPDWGSNKALISEKGVALMGALGITKSFRYIYDFGDHWQHDIRIEKSLLSEAYPRTLLCIAGENACPPEDVGGPPGYNEFLQAISDPKHPEHDEMLDWCGGHFDSKAFDVNAVNKKLQRVKA